MRFGKTENNCSTKICKYILALFIFSGCAFSAACQSREKKIDAALKQCQEMLDKDDLNGAYQCYLKVGTNYPENDPRIVDFADKSIFRKCVEFKKREDFERAAFCLDGLTKLRPGGANIYFLLADSYYEIFKTKDKETYFRDVDLLNKAEDKLKKGLEIDPKDAPAHTLYGHILKDKGISREALKEYKKAVEISPKTEIFWAYLALAQENFEEDQGAIESYNQVLFLNPNNTLSLYHLGKLYEKTGKVDKAIENFEKLSKIDPAYDDVPQRLKALKEQREFEQQKPKKSKTKTAP